MARGCKCKICGTHLNTDIAYRVVVKDKASYYCSAAEYEDFQRAKEKEKLNKDKVFNLVSEVLGFAITPSLLMKEWKEWNMLATDEILGNYLEENKDYLAGCISRLSGNSFGKMRYLSKTIQSNLMGWKPKVEPKIEIKISTEEHYETKYKPKERVGLMDLEEFDE